MIYSEKNKKVKCNKYIKPKIDIIDYFYDIITTSCLTDKPGPEPWPCNGD